MSDESPPPLRLKLRSDAAARPPDNPPPEPPPAPPTVGAAGPAGGAEPAAAPAKLRLKPRLAPSEPAPASEPATETAPTEPAESASVPLSRASSPAQETPAETPATPHVAPAAEPPPPPTAAMPHPPVVLGAAEPPRPPVPQPQPPIPHVRAPAQEEEPPEPEAPPPLPPRAPDPVKAFRKGTMLLIVGAVVIVAGASGYFYYRLATDRLELAPATTGAPNAARLPMNRMPGPAPTEGRGPSDSGGSSSAGTPPAKTTLGKAVEKARETATAQTNRVASMPVDGETAPNSTTSTMPALPPANPASGGAASGTGAPTPGEEDGVMENGVPLGRVQIGPGVTATTSVLLASEGASVEFQRWVAELRVSGVFQGQPARALIDGRRVSAGETVNPALRVVFAGVDVPAKMLVFRDASGAVVKRKY